MGVFLLWTSNCGRGLKPRPFWPKMYSNAWFLENILRQKSKEYPILILRWKHNIATIKVWIWKRYPQPLFSFFLLFYPMSFHYIIVDCRSITHFTSCFTYLHNTQQADSDAKCRIFSSATVSGVLWAMSALAQHTQHSAHTMRTPTLQPVPESLPVADHVSSVANSKSVKSKVGAHLFDPSAPAVKKVIRYNHLNFNPVKENQKRINIINFKMASCCSDQNYHFHVSGSFFLIF